MKARRFDVPLGITIVGGLIFSQMLTLYTTPVVYLYLDRLTRRREVPTTIDRGRSSDPSYTRPMSGALFLLLLAAAPPTWQAVAPGVEHLSVDDDGLGAEMLRFDLGRYRPEVVVSGAGRPRTAAAVRAETAAAAAVNGGFFDTEGRPLGLRIAAGKTVIGLRPRVDWGVLLVQGGRAQIVHSRDFRSDPTIETAVQVGPRILVGGRPLRLKPQSARRTAVALERDGRTLTLVVTRAAIEADRLAALLARLGFETALMLDGGPSTQLSAAVGSVRLDVSGGYPVPDALVIHKR